MEADSINAAVLAPDLDSDGDTFDLFLREVAKDITQKAGQKCTAIRRVFVPSESMDLVRDALIGELERVRVGDPGLREVKMGPLCNAAQLKDVREGVDAIAAQAKMVFGDGGRGNLVGIDNERGYFMSPVLFEAEDARSATVVHAHEVFGPAATLIPYSGSAEEAAELVSLGCGGLVSSYYSDDAKLAGAYTLNASAHHGRIHLGSVRMAEASPGPGTTLPPLVHGGPGRAGSGEELGGERSLAFYMQRTAVQGAKPMLEKILMLS